MLLKDTSLYNVLDKTRFYIEVEIVDDIANLSNNFITGEQLKDLHFRPKAENVTRFYDSDAIKAEYRKIINSIPPNKKSVAVNDEEFIAACNYFSISYLSDTHVLASGRMKRKPVPKKELKPEEIKNIRPTDMVSFYHALEYTFQLPGFKLDKQISFKRKLQGIIWLRKLLKWQYLEEFNKDNYYFKSIPPQIRKQIKSLWTSPKKLQSYIDNLPSKYK